RRSRQRLCLQDGEIEDPAPAIVHAPVINPPGNGGNRPPPPVADRPEFLYPAIVQIVIAIGEQLVPPGDTLAILDPEADLGVPLNLVGGDFYPGLREYQAVCRTLRDAVGGHGPFARNQAEPAAVGNKSVARYAEPATVGLQGQQIVA